MHCGCPPNQFCGKCLPECERCTELTEIYLVIWETYENKHPEISATFTLDNAKDMLTTLVSGMVHLHGGDELVDVEYTNKEDYADTPRRVWVGIDLVCLASGYIKRTQGKS